MQSPLRATALACVSVLLVASLAATETQHESEAANAALLASFTEPSGLRNGLDALTRAAAAVEGPADADRVQRWTRQLDWDEAAVSTFLERNAGVLEQVDQAMGTKALWSPRDFASTRSPEERDRWGMLVHTLGLRAARTIRLGDLHHGLRELAQLVELGSRLQDDPRGNAFLYRIGLLASSSAVEQLEALAQEPHLGRRHLIMVKNLLAPVAAERRARVRQKERELLAANGRPADPAGGPLSADSRAQAARAGEPCEADTSWPRSCELASKRAVARTLAVLRLYHQDHRALPRGLEALVPDYLNALPIDEWGGEPLRYSARRGLLYSVGRDLDDSRGNEGDLAVTRLDFDA